jgi:hypothetical protein
VPTTSASPRRPLYSVPLNRSQRFSHTRYHPAVHRCLFNFLSAASLFLCLVTCVLWLRSYRNQWHGDRLAFDAARDVWELRSEGGGLTLYRRDHSPWFFAGPATGGKPVARYNWQGVLGFPYWLAVAATAPLPTTRASTLLRRRRRVAKGLCRTCGYDVRMTPARCPECGNAVQVPAPALSGGGR